MPTYKETFDTQMNALADSINTKAGTTGKKTIAEMKTAVDSISTGITPTGNQDIETLNEYDVTAKATARVSAAERAKIVAGNIKNGVTILGVTGTAAVVTIYTITVSVTNGTYSGATTIASGFASIGTITPSTDYIFPSSITVNNATLNSYDSTTGVFVISGATGNVTVTADCQPAGWSGTDLTGTTWRFSTEKPLTEFLTPSARIEGMFSAQSENYSVQETVTRGMQLSNSFALWLFEKLNSSSTEYYPRFQIRNATGEVRYAANSSAREDVSYVDVTIHSISKAYISSQEVAINDSRIIEFFKKNAILISW